jgi:tellurite resistance protein TerC
MNIELLFFIGFIVFIVAVLILDLRIIGRKSHVVSFKEAAIWSSIWIGVALLFFVFLRIKGEVIHGIGDLERLREVAGHYLPHLHLDKLLNYEVAVEQFRINTSVNYLTGYLIEKTLSVDNIFVILLILKSFSVKPEYYKPVLFWGVLGAIILRFVFIFAGAAIIDRFEWVLYVFGAYLIFAGGKMFIHRNKQHQTEPKDHFLVKYLGKHFKILPHFEGQKFWIRKKEGLYFTPLFIILVLVEFSDLIFALDSIPAIFAVSRDPYIVFYSNIFAILGLRALFFLLIQVIDKFHLLVAGVSILLVYVGLKLIFTHWLHEIGFQSIYSLYIILTVLLGSIVLSVIFPKREEQNKI